MKLTIKDEGRNLSGMLFAETNIYGNKFLSNTQYNPKLIQKL